MGEEVGALGAHPRCGPVVITHVGDLLGWEPCNNLPCPRCGNIDPYDHRTASGRCCKQCGDCEPGDRFGVLIQSNGVKQVFRRCKFCWLKTRGVIRHRDLPPHIHIDALPILRDNLRDCCLGVGCQSCSYPCARCGGYRSVERHHWAPWHLFPNEAHEWPTSYLCRECHRRWHSIVTPRMGNRGAA